MTIRRVFVVWTHPLFRESVRLLLNHPDVEWTGSTSNYEAAQEEIVSLQPDTILVEEIEGNMPASIVTILKLCPENTRLIGLNLNNNQLNVYHHERRSVSKVESLLHLLFEDLKPRGGR